MDAAAAAAAAATHDPLRAADNVLRTYLTQHWRALQEGSYGLDAAGAAGRMERVWREVFPSPPAAVAAGSTAAPTCHVDPATHPTIAALQVGPRARSRTAAAAVAARSSPAIGALDARGYAEEILAALQRVAVQSFDAAAEELPAVAWLKALPEACTRRCAADLAYSDDQVAGVWTRFQQRCVVMTRYGDPRGGIPAVADFNLRSARHVRQAVEHRLAGCDGDAIAAAVRASLEALRRRVKVDEETPWVVAFHAQRIPPLTAVNYLAALFIHSSDFSSCACGSLDECAKRPMQHRTPPAAPRHPAAQGPHGGAGAIQTWLDRVAAGELPRFSDDLARVVAHTEDLLRDFAAMVDEAVAALPSGERRVITRGVGTPIARRYAVGARLHRAPFTSSYSEDAEDPLACLDTTKHGTLYLLRTASARAVDFASTAPGRAEALVPRDAYFDVTRKVPRSTLRRLRCNFDVVMMAECDPFGDGVDGATPVGCETRAGSGRVAQPLHAAATTNTTDVTAAAPAAGTTNVEGDGVPSVASTATAKGADPSAEAIPAAAGTSTASFSAAAEESADWAVKTGDAMAFIYREYLKSTAPTRVVARFEVHGASQARSGSGGQQQQRLRGGRNAFAAIAARAGGAAAAEELPPAAAVLGDSSAAQAPPEELTAAVAEWVKDVDARHAVITGRAGAGTSTAALKVAGLVTTQHGGYAVVLPLPALGRGSVYVPGAVDAALLRHAHLTPDAWHALLARGIPVVVVLDALDERADATPATLRGGLLAHNPLLNAPGARVVVAVRHEALVAAELYDARVVLQPTAAGRGSVVVWNVADMRYDDAEAMADIAMSSVMASKAAAAAAAASTAGTPTPGTAAASCPGADAGSTPPPSVPGSPLPGTPPPSTRTRLDQKLQDALGGGEELQALKKQVAALPDVVRRTPALLAMALDLLVQPYRRQVDADHDGSAHEDAGGGHRDAAHVNAGGLSFSANHSSSILARFPEIPATRRGLIDAYVASVVHPSGEGRGGPDSDSAVASHDRLADLALHMLRAASWGVPVREARQILGCPHAAFDVPLFCCDDPYDDDAVVAFQHRLAAEHLAAVALARRPDAIVEITDTIPPGVKRNTLLLLLEEEGEAVVDAAIDALLVSNRDPQAVVGFIEARVETLRGDAAAAAAAAEEVGRLPAALDRLALARHMLGEHAAAQHLLEESLAIKECRHEPHDGTFVDTLWHLGRVQGALGDRSAALKTLDRCAVISEGHYGAAHVKHAAVLGSLGAAYGALGDYAMKREIYEKTWSLLERHYGVGSVQVIPTVRALANTYGALGDVHKHRKLLEKCVDLLEKHLGPHHIALAGVLEDACGVYEKLEEPSLKTAAIERCLQVKQDHFGPDHAALTAPLQDLAEVAAAKGNVNEQKALLERCMALQEKHQGLKSVALAVTYLNLGKVYRKLGDAAARREVLEKCLEVSEANHGAESLEVADTLLQLGSAYSGTGDNEKEAAVLARCVEIQEKVYGKDDLRLAVGLDSLGNAHRKLGNTHGYKEQLERCIALKEKQLGAGHVSFASTLATLGTVYGELGDHEKKRELLERCLSLQERARGATDTSLAVTLIALGTTYGDLGDHARRCEVLERCLCVQEQGGIAGTSMIPTLTALGNTYSDLGRHADARAALERCLHLKIEQTGDGDPSLIGTLNALGAVHGAAGDLALKKEVLTHSLAIQERQTGTGHISLAVTLHGLGTVCGALNQHEESLAVFERCVRLHEDTFSVRHPSLAAPLNTLSCAYAGVGDHAKRKDVLERSLAIEEAHHGKESPALICTLNNLANAYGDLGDADKRKSLKARCDALQTLRASSAPRAAPSPASQRGSAADAAGDVKPMPPLAAPETTAADGGMVAEG